MVVGPNDITLAFVDYFDFWQVPIMDLRYFRCRILTFPSYVAYEGREALVEALNAKVFHDEATDRKQVPGICPLVPSTHGVSPFLEV